MKMGCLNIFVPSILGFYFYFKVFIEFVVILLSILCFGFFGLEAHGILAPQPGTKLASSALENKVLTTRFPRKCLFLLYIFFKLIYIFPFTFLSAIFYNFQHTSLIYISLVKLIHNYLILLDAIVVKLLS